MPCPRGKHLNSSYWLIGLGTTLVAGVGSDGHHGLDLGGAGHDASHRDKMADTVGTHITDHLGFVRRWGLEVHLTVDRKTSGLTIKGPCFITRHASVLTNHFKIDQLCPGGSVHKCMTDKRPNSSPLWR